MVALVVAYVIVDVIAHSGGGGGSVCNGCDGGGW